MVRLPLRAYDSQRSAAFEFRNVCVDVAAIYAGDDVEPIDGRVTTARGSRIIVRQDRYADRELPPCYPWPDRKPPQWNQGELRAAVLSLRPGGLCGRIHLDDLSGERTFAKDARLEPGVFYLQVALMYHAALVDRSDSMYWSRSARA